jgi:hypothetical protein
VFVFVHVDPAQTYMHIDYEQLILVSNACVSPAVLAPFRTRFAALHNENQRSNFFIYLLLYLKNIMRQQKLLSCTFKMLG